MRPKQDNRGEETFAPFLFIIVIIIALLIVLGAWTSSQAQYTGAEGNAVIGGVAYSWFAPTNGRPVSYVNVTNHYDPWSSGLATVLAYHKTGDSNPYYVQVVRNNTEVGNPNPFWDAQWKVFPDFVGVQHAGWWPWTWDSRAISFEALNVAHASPNFKSGNVSVVNFLLGGQNLTISVTTRGPAANYSQDLYNMKWLSLTVGQSIQAQVQDSANAAWWNVAVQLFTFSLPNVPWVLSVLISGMVWGGIGFIAFISLTRLLHGGG